MTDDVDDKTERRIRAGQTVRIVVMVAVAAVLVAWALANQNDVEVDWLIDTTQVSLVVVIALSAVMGFLFGVVLSWRRQRR